MLIGYARVSTQDQNPQLQLDALEKAGCERVFVEKASGAQRDRPELRAALDYMRSGDTLVVWKLDRLARSIKQLIETVEMLDEQTIGFRSLTEAIDTTTSSGRLVFHIFAALAEFERGIIRERTKAGLASARARGRVGGRPSALSKEDLAVAKALLRDPNITVDKVAKRLNVSPSTLYRHLPGGRSSIEQTDRGTVYAENITNASVRQTIAEDVPTPPSNFRIKPAHLQLLKKAANATLASPAYVTRDTAHYSQLLELTDAGFVETFSRGNSSRRVYFQLTDAGLEASKKHFREL